MIDTLKLLIKVSESQHQQIQSIAVKEDRWQWVQFNHGISEMRFRQYDGVMRTNSQSFHREIRWKVSDYWSEDARLIVEFSVPKYWYGHNIHLLYNWFNALEEFRKELNQYLQLDGENELPPVGDWELARADVCYAWKLPSQERAKEFLNALKGIKFPWKQRILYTDTILFPGATYSLKFYLKLPEFKKHDLRTLIKQKASLEWINYLEHLADGVLRVEATLRKLYLKRAEIHTVSDLVSQKTQIFWQDEVPETEEQKLAFLHAVSLYAYWKVTGKQELDFNQDVPLQDGQLLECSKGELELDGRRYEIPALRAIYRRTDQTVYILQTLLEKFIGAAPMRTVDKVRAVLLEHYKPVKAGRLIGFWLYVQRFGTEEAKNIFGENSYYVSKRDLKKAGVSLVEPPKPTSSSTVPADFFEQFRLAIPSDFVVNKFDVDRDSPKIVRFPEREQAQ